MRPRLATAALLLVAGACVRRAPEPPAAAAPTAPAAPAAAVALQPVNPHDRGDEKLCARCHAPGETRLALEPIAVCAQCHDPAEMRHPYGVPQPNPPAGLTFASDGRIVCHTCHDPHDVKAHAHGLRRAYSELCLECHVRHGTKAPAAGSR